MLNEAEQRRLTEIESQLRGEDPSFVRRFDDRGQNPPQRKWYGPGALLATAVAIAVAVTGLLVGSVAAVVAAQTAIGAIVGLWLTYRRRR